MCGAAITSVLRPLLAELLLGLQMLLFWLLLLLLLLLELRLRLALLLLVEPLAAAGRTILLLLAGLL